MIELDAVSVTYENGTRALESISAQIDKGEFVYLVGPTGEGKSTFLKVIYREVVPVRGRVIVSGTEVTRMPRSRVPYLRRNIGVVFQDFRLLPDKTAFENVAYAMEVMGVRRRTLLERVSSLLAQVGLEHKGGAYPSQLSGGEQQRVSIARALINRPRIFLADEPTGNLDPETSWGIVGLLTDINLQGATVVVATHDREIVNRSRKRVISLAAGRVVRDESEGGYDPAPY
jgi:cell division transport system ATP-binding protein